MDVVVICTISCHSKVAFVCTTMFICSKQILGRSGRWPVFQIPGEEVLLDLGHC